MGDHSLQEKLRLLIKEHQFRQKMPPELKEQHVQLEGDWCGVIPLCKASLQRSPAASGEEGSWIQCFLNTAVSSSQRNRARGLPTPEHPRVLARTQSDAQAHHNTPKMKAPQHRFVGRKVPLIDVWLWPLGKH